MIVLMRYNCNTGYAEERQSFDTWECGQQYLSSVMSDLTSKGFGIQRESKNKFACWIGRTRFEYYLKYED